VLQIAQKRYLESWVAPYARLNKKAAWELYTGGSGYPALGTFYKHVKDEGSVEQYLRRSSSNAFQKALKQMKIEDGENQELHVAREKIPAPNDDL
jgi:hypothetical protein